MVKMAQDSYFRHAAQIKQPRILIIDIWIKENSNKMHKGLLDALYVSYA
jgi:hypothetical protein